MYQKIFQQHAKLLKALSNSKRLEIMQLLRGQSLSVSEMVKMLGLPQANLSQHLMVLRQFKVVETKRRGKEIYYHIKHKNFTKAADLVREVLFERLGKKITRAAEQLTVVVDPVCRMRLTPASAATSLVRDGKNYFFCGSGCRNLFHKT
ncbi:MAG: metalloregulator ArsR/SmtB family transcription factor [Patescibacteria group bacterium]